MSPRTTCRLHDRTIFVCSVGVRVVNDSDAEIKAERTGDEARWSQHYHLGFNALSMPGEPSLVAFGIPAE